MDDVAVTWDVKCIACLGPQGLALHYDIIAKGFEGRLCRMFDDESCVLCSACKVTQHQVLDLAKLISSRIFFYDFLEFLCLNKK